MKKLVVIGILILILGIMVSGVSFALMGFSFGGFAEEKYENRETACGTDITRIEIRANIEKVTVLRAEGDSCRVICSENDALKHTVAVEDGVLTVRSEDTRKWYEHIGFNVNVRPKITVYVPPVSCDLDITTDTGDVEIDGAFSWKDIRIRTDTGDVVCRDAAEGSVSVQTSTGDIHWALSEDPLREGLNVAGDLALQVTTGRIRAEHVRCGGNVTIRVSTGKTSLEDFACVNLESAGSTGDITLKDTFVAESLSIRRSTGDVRLENSDAGELHVHTDTGSVTGTLLSPKVFFTETDTGKVQVPRSLTGGECEITTDTGDIRIGIAE